jgi:predicted nucleotidyltransferase
VDQKQVDKFLREFIPWISTQNDVQAVALVGSYARKKAKETSDLDIIIIAQDPKRLIKNNTWIELFGIVTYWQIEEYGPLTSIRVWYSDNREIEYGITDENWARMPLDNGTNRVISEGIIILFERWPILRQHIKKK